MVTLVLAIDRDNDLGRKTGIRSPVIGREANLAAAQELGLADPEESDTNTTVPYTHLTLPTSLCQ